MCCHISRSTQWTQWSKVTGMVEVPLRQDDMPSFISWLVKSGHATVTDGEANVHMNGWTEAPTGSRDVCDTRLDLSNSANWLTWSGEEERRTVTDHSNHSQFSPCFSQKWHRGLIKYYELTIETKSPSSGAALGINHLASSSRLFLKPTYQLPLTPPKKKKNITWDVLGKLVIRAHSVKLLDNIWHVMKPSAAWNEIMSGPFSIWKQNSVYLTPFLCGFWVIQKKCDRDKS